jgi:N-acetylglutamate synthase-like GNAT family acetyltransferase
MPTIRRALRADIDVLTQLIQESVRILQRDRYTQAQIELGLAHVYGVDTTLIDDGTYFLLEDGSLIVACGGWSKRATLHGGDHYTARDEKLLDPATDAAKIRAFFVRPGWERRGLGTRLLEHCESAAAAAGFRRVELSATLSGLAFYAASGYTELGATEVPLPQGEALAIVHMGRVLAARASQSSVLSD